MTTEEMQNSVKQQIVQARKNNKTKGPRELWIELYNSEVPTIEEFSDCYQSVLYEETQSDESSQSETKNTTEKTESKSAKKAT